MAREVILVTGYEDPDLDAVACAYAYAELLCAQGKDAIAGIFGLAHPEAKFVLDACGAVLGDASQIHYDSIVLVDVSDPDDIRQIDPKKVIEVIDHRAVHSAHLFSNAKIHIEPVGSAATLIAEKYMTSRMVISPQAALLLYCAIASNTITFKASVTTSRDRIVAAMLEKHARIPKEFVREMFAQKSRILSVQDAIFQDSTCKNINGIPVGISQLELLDGKRFVFSHLNEIRAALEKFHEKNHTSMTFLTCTDIDAEQNVFVALEPHTEEVLISLGARYEDGALVRDGITLRKQLFALLKDRVK